MEAPKGRFIKVSKVLNANTTIAGIPSDQLVPWAIFLFIAAALWTNGVGVYIVVPLIFWSCGTWWLVMGSQSWRFMNKFHKPPRWVNGNLRYTPKVKTRYAISHKSQSQKGKDT